MKKLALIALFAVLALPGFTADESTNAFVELGIEAFCHIQQVDDNRSIVDQEHLLVNVENFTEDNTDVFIGRDKQELDFEWFTNGILDVECEIIDYAVYNDANVLSILWSWDPIPTVTSALSDALGSVVTTTGGTVRSLPSDPTNDIIEEIIYVGVGLEAPAATEVDVVKIVCTCTAQQFAGAQYDWQADPLSAWDNEGKIN